MQESGEMYLETILLLKKRNGIVKAVDIAKELEYSKPSISRAVANLKKEGYINILEDGNIVLTKTGQTKASYIYEKHCIISDFLSESLNLSKKEVEENACRIEHVITDKCFKKIKEYINKNNLKRY